MLSLKKQDEIIEKLFSVLTENKNLDAEELQEIAERFTDCVRSAGDYLVAEVKVEEFVERGWKKIRPVWLNHGEKKKQKGITKDKNYE